MASGDNERHQEDVMHDRPGQMAFSGTFVGAIRAIAEQMLANQEFVTIGKVEEYDRAKHVAIVQPMVKFVGPQGHTVNPSLVVCNVWRYSCGGFTIDLPIKKGDTGWLIASDNDTTNAKKSTDIELPPTLGHHEYAYGFFIPDKFGEMPLNDDVMENNRLVIQTHDGSQCISMGQSDLKIVCSRFIVDAETVDITGHTQIHLDSPSVKLKGKVSLKPGASGAITFANIAMVHDGIVTGIYPEP